MLAKLIMFLIIVMPHVIKAVEKIDEVIEKLPLRIFRGLLGLGLCFFGGVFPLTVAAVEAWKLAGGDAAMEAIKELRKDFSTLKDANDIENTKDDNHDGIADVLQMSGHELLLVKTKLALKVIKPEHVTAQVTCLYTGWIGVVAALKLQFAKTIALGAAIGAKFYEFAQKSVEPLVVTLVPEEYAQWVPWAIKSGCKALAIYIAWWVQRVISAVFSAVRGGNMAGKEFVNFAFEKGYLKGNDTETYLDEVAAVIFAGLGLFVQLRLGFGIPFPLNVIAWPLYFVEGWIAWSINS